MKELSLKLLRCLQTFFTTDVGRAVKGAPLARCPEIKKQKEEQFVNLSFRKRFQMSRDSKVEMVEMILEAVFWFKLNCSKIGSYNRG